MSGVTQDSMTMQQAKKLRKLLGKRAMWTLYSEAYVDWAVEALVDGLDSPSLRILAGLPRPQAWSEVEHYFQSALSELDIPIPSNEDAIRLYQRDVAENIVAGRITPTDGCNELYRIWKGADYPNDLWRWLSLSEGHERESYRELTDAELDAAIREEAAMLLD